jgi:hypothetical protein
MARYEGSAADMKADKAGAKKAGMSMSAWEKSPVDKRKDAKGQAAMNKAKKRKK